MNIKFRMPKLWGNAKFQGTLKEITLSIIATTISIILTFGTAHYIEEKNKKATARQTAMMVIHDIENSIEELRDMAKYEEKNRDLIQQVQKCMAESDSVDQDTIWAVISYLTTSADQMKLYNFDEPARVLVFKRYGTGNEQFPLGQNADIGAGAFMVDSAAD